MPKLSTEYELTETNIKELEDEKIGEKEFYCYEFSYSIVTKTGKNSSVCQEKVKIMIEKQPIIFDDPTVEPWDDPEDSELEL